MTQELVREQLLRHARSPRNGQFPAHPHYVAKITNPLCGDHVELRIHSPDDVVQELGFRVAGCAICTASASLLSQEAEGKSLPTLLGWAHLFEASLSRTSERTWAPDLEPFRCFEHIQVNPARRMCALLPWVVLRTALRERAVAHE